MNSSSNRNSRNNHIIASTQNSIRVGPTANIITNSEITIRTGQNNFGNTQTQTDGPVPNFNFRNSQIRPSEHIFTSSPSHASKNNLPSLYRNSSYCVPACPTSCTSYSSYNSGSCSTAFDPYITTAPPPNLKEIRCNRRSTDKLASRFALPTVLIPSWIAYGGVVLNFYAYFQEPIPESQIETYRIHRCEIRYYMEDDTIEVIEPATFDPGYKQGRIINRCRIQLPLPCDDHYFTIEHLMVGCEITFYCKTFHICGCDNFTRTFMNKLGFPVQQNVEVPHDPSTLKRQDLVTSLFARRASGGNLERKKTEKFLLNNRKILRFWAYWDDRCSEYGVLRHFTINYYLEDDTISITELLKPNSGFEHFASFVGRIRLPKDPNKLVPLPGIREEALLVLNVVGIDKCGCEILSSLSDRLCPGIEESEYYKDTDLAIGATINVFGRCFIITDMDEFTKRYYKDKYCIEDFTPLTLDEKTPSLPRMEPPPHIGIGDEEDTLANWDRIQIEAPRKNDLHLLLNDKDILGFSVQLHKSLQKVNSVRRFILSFFMGDGTIQIFEKQHPNSGLKKGLFLARMRVKKPTNLEIATSNQKTEYFIAQDFYIGAEVILNGFNFLITEADEFTLSYMEHNHLVFQQSNVCTILNKMREACGPIQADDLLLRFSEKDTCGQGIQDYVDFKNLVMDISQCGLSEHELITLKRAYKVQAPEPGPDFDTLKAVIQTELKRFNFDKRLLQRIEYTLRYHDPCRLGLVDRETLRSSLKGAKLPVAKELIDFLVDKYPAGDHCGRVNYCEILCFLDWEKNGGIDAFPSAIPCIMKWIEPKAPYQISCVNYRAFLEDICPNFKCALPLICCPNSCGDEVGGIQCSYSGSAEGPSDNNNCDQGQECNSNPHDGWDEFYGPA